MDYFKDVYLKRINRYGDNVRSRIVGDKEHEYLSSVQYIKH